MLKARPGPNPEPSVDPDNWDSQCQETRDSIRSNPSSNNVKLGSARVYFITISIYILGASAQIAQKCKNVSLRLPLVFYIQIWVSHAMHLNKTADWFLFAFIENTQ